MAASSLFAAWRGINNFLYSDCGINFVGADKQFHPHFNEDSAVLASIGRYLTENGTTWSFNPPASPHFEGLWQAAARSVKHHLYPVVAVTTLIFEETSTFLTQVEACLNSRLLQVQDDDPSDLVPLM